MSSGISAISFIFLFILSFSRPVSGMLPALMEPASRYSICRYCLCDEHSFSVICTGAHMLLKTVNLPRWAETFYAHNLTMPQFPHFAYHPGLKILRINHCGLSEIHPLALIPLPNLETIHFENNLLSAIPETLFQRLTRLRILNLAGNQLEMLDRLEWALPTGLVLDQLVMDGNPISMGLSEQADAPWPLAKQLHLARANVEMINSTHLIFKVSLARCNFFSKSFFKPTYLDFGPMPTRSQY